MITQSQIEEIKRRIVENFKPQKIIIFGSYVEGTLTDESDLDLLIIVNSEKNSDLQAYQIRRLLADLKIPVDVIIKTLEEFEIYKDIIGTIAYPANRFGLVIYESK